MRCSSLIVLCSCLIAGPALGSSDSARVEFGDVVVGVDELGRVLVALDSAADSDDKVDEFFLFTGEDRLEPTWWEHVDDAVVTVKDRSLKVVGPDARFVVLLTVRNPKGASGSGNGEGPGQAPPGAFVFRATNGLELAMVTNSPLFGIDHGVHDHVWDQLQSWPESFWYDYHDPASGQCVNGDDCDAGGEGANACSVTCSVFSGCEVSCGNPDDFACCKCFFFFFTCRCRPCIPGP